MKNRLGGNVIHRYLKASVVGASLLALSACQTTAPTPSLQVSGDDTQTREMDGAQLTLLRTAQQAQAAHNHEAAANAYGRLFRLRSTDANVLMNFIRSMRYSGRAGEIIRYLEDNPSRLMEVPTVQFEYAKALIASGEYAKATLELQKSKQAMPNDWRVHSAMGIAHAALEQQKQALSSFHRALSLSPKNVSVLNNLAMAHASAGELEAAIDHLVRAARIDRRHAQVRQNLALLYAIRGDGDEARLLAAMDLDAEDLESNLSFYNRFQTQQAQQ